MRHTLARVARTFSSISLVAGSACASLSARTPTPAYHFLERNYFVWPPKDTSLLYEALPAAHLFLVDGLPLAYDRLTRTEEATGEPQRNAYALRLVTSPMFRIRQLKDSSAAVRTPSFMPRILAIEQLWVHGLGTPLVLGNNVKYSRLLLSGERLSLTHHSNGQAGCFRQGYRPKDAHANECEPIPITDPTKVLPRDTMLVKLNGSDGDFSSTFVSAMVHATYLSDFSHGDTPKWSMGVAAAYDWHPHGVFGALSDEQRPLYGSWRVHGQVEGMLVSGLGCPDVHTRTLLERVACAVRGRSRFTVEGERAPRATGPLAARFDPPILPWRGSIELSHAFYWALGTGLFVRWNDGQDYYNIGFVNRRRITMVGLMLDVGGPDLLRKKDPTNP
jgi:hypothetical protein